MSVWRLFADCCARGIHLTRHPSCLLLRRSGREMNDIYLYISPSVRHRISVELKNRAQSFKVYIFSASALGLAHSPSHALGASGFDIGGRHQIRWSASLSVSVSVMRITCCACRACIRGCPVPQHRVPKKTRQTRFLKIDPVLFSPRDRLSPEIVEMKQHSQPSSLPPSPKAAAPQHESEAPPPSPKVAAPQHELEASRSMSKKDILGGAGELPHEPTNSRSHRKPAHRQAATVAHRPAPQPPSGKKPEWNDRCCTAGDDGLHVPKSQRRGRSRRSDAKPSSKRSASTRAPLALERRGLWCLGRMAPSEQTHAASPSSSQYTRWFTRI